MLLLLMRPRLARLSMFLLNLIVILLFLSHYQWQWLLLLLIQIRLWHHLILVTGFQWCPIIPLQFGQLELAFTLVFIQVLLQKGVVHLFIARPGQPVCQVHQILGNPYLLDHRRFIKKVLLWKELFNLFLNEGHLQYLIAIRSQTWLGLQQSSHNVAEVHGEVGRNLLENSLEHFLV